MNSGTHCTARELLCEISWRRDQRRGDPVQRRTDRVLLQSRLALEARLAGIKAGDSPKEVRWRWIVPIFMRYLRTSQLSKVVLRAEADNQVEEGR